MSTYRIDAENAITIYATKEEAARDGEGERFGSVAALARLAEGWPAGRLVEIWNGIPGVVAVKRFANRKAGVERVWEAIQGLKPARAGSSQEGRW